MSSKTIVVNESVILSSASQWPLWIGMIRRLAETEDIWECIDPYRQEHKQLYSRPVAPTASSIRPGATLTTLSEPEFQRYQSLQRSYTNDLTIYRDQKKVIREIMTIIFSSVDVKYQIYLQSQSDLRTILAILKQYGS